MRKLATAIAVWFGAGYVPKGPGTAGAAAAVLCAAPFPQYINWLAVGSILPAIWAADVHAKSKGAKDPQEVVVDEVVGTWIALAGATHLHTIWPWLLAFGLFRLMRITEAHDYDLVGDLIDEGRPMPKPAQPLFPILAAHQTPNTLPHR